MSDTRKKRMSMLDSLAAAGTPGGAGAPMMASNRALRSARDAVDSHRVWELDPGQIDDNRTRDRLDPSDVVDLRDAIEANGQTVPILVRRNPEQDGRYLLVEAMVGGSRTDLHLLDRRPGRADRGTALGGTLSDLRPGLSPGRGAPARRRC